MLSGIGIKPRKTLRVQVDADVIAEHRTLIEAVVAMKSSIARFRRVICAMNLMAD